MRVARHKTRFSHNLLSETMIKRTFDFIAALLGLIVLSPLMLIMAVLVRLTSPGPAFYLQKRIGKSGEPFKIFKFRTMYIDADKRGGTITVGRDPRITPIGHILRKLKFDEFAQLINVVKGDMSLVGPRPETPNYVELYSAEQRRVLSVKPGITDPASIKFRNENDLLAGAKDPNETYIKEIMPAKLKINLEYLDRQSLLGDIGIIFQTFYWVFVSKLIPTKSSNEPKS